MFFVEKELKQVRDRQWGRCAMCGKPMMGSEPRPLNINKNKPQDADMLVLLCRDCHPKAKKDRNCTNVPHLPERTYRFYHGKR